MTERNFAGVAGTVTAFNFIRGIRFPTTTELASGFCTMVFFASVLSMPISGYALAAVLTIPTTVIILPSFIGEYFSAHALLRSGRLLDFRRLMGVEVIAWAPLLIFLPATAILGGIYGRNLWLHGLLLTIAVSLPVRILTVFSMSIVPAWRKLIAGAITPGLSALGYSLGLVFHNELDSRALILVGAVTITAFLLSTLGVRAILRRVESHGSPLVRDSPISLFRDFLHHWLRSEPALIEARLAALGSDADAESSILAFRGSKHDSACLVLSGFHPGPYRDLGSGGLPSTLKASLESGTVSVALIPHSVSSHERNIITQTGLAKFVETTKQLYPTEMTLRTASPLTRQEVDGAKASAQFFGNVVLITLTLAPDNMEDLPIESQNSISTTASDRGSIPLVIDAHNALSGPTSISLAEAKMLGQAAQLALESALSQTQGDFGVGMATDPLSEFSLEDGIGPGGIAVLVIRTAVQTVAYTTVDGNNMRPGLRERILARLKEIGIDDGEVMTTDTHLVTGLARSRLGYYPVGDGIPQGLFVERIGMTARKAMENITSGSAGYAGFQISLRVLGSKSFEAITSFVAAVSKRVGRDFLRLEIVVTLVAIAVLALA